jgi:hypothetical protein
VDIKDYKGYNANTEMSKKILSSEVCKPHALLYLYKNEDYQPIPQ